MFNATVNPPEISTIENIICTNPTPVIEADAKTGKTNICKNLWNNEFIQKICICLCQKWKVVE